MTENHPDGSMPARERSDLGPFARRMLPENFATPDARSSSRAIRTDSPVSIDSGEHTSDGEFIDDDE